VQHWIDRSSKSKNVTIANASSICVASCDKEHYDEVDHRLTAGETAADVLGSDGLKVILFSQIQSIVSRDTDVNVDITYKVKKGENDISIDFEDTEKSADFVEFITAHLPKSLIRTEKQQSIVAAALLPILSVIFGLLVGFFYFNKMRLIVYAVVSIWTLGSLYMLFKRVTNPPLITRWKLKGKLAKKTWSGIKTGWSYALTILVVFGISAKFPDRHGSQALIQLAEEDMLEAANISVYLSRGADLEATDEAGDTALWWAIYNHDDELTLALLDAGSNTTMADGYLLEFALDYNASDEVIRTMLNSGVLEVAEAADNFDTEYYMDPEYFNFPTLLEEYRGPQEQALAQIED